MNQVSRRIPSEPIITGPIPYDGDWELVKVTEVKKIIPKSFRKIGTKPESKHQIIRRCWQDIRREVFPKWDQQGEWWMRLSSVGAEHGRCYPDKKLITIAWVLDGKDERDALMIHEICHAVTSGSHGEPWLRRMEKAAAHAQALDRRQLAELLETQITEYREAGPSSVNEVYSELSDAVFDAPHVSYSDFRKHFAYQYAMSIAEFDEYFPRAIKVYLQAKHQREQYNQNRARMLSRTGLSAESD